MLSDLQDALVIHSRFKNFLRLCVPAGSKVTLGVGLAAQTPVLQINCTAIITL